MLITDPAFNYDQYGHQYSGYRQTDPRIAAFVNEALGQAQTVLNVGAGAGSYEPADKYVVAVEPSKVMRAQRLKRDKVPAIDAKAGDLPFDDNAFDAAMAMVTVHHWPDIRKGLQELRRVTKGPVLVMTFDPGRLDHFWNARYFPELIAIEKARYPSIDFICDALGGNSRVIPIPIPLDCTDGFQEAFYGRPEAFLDEEVRRAQSAWGFLKEGQEAELVQRLAGDLASGGWEQQYGHFRHEPTFTGALQLIVTMP
ncbi:class I SAM-dependent methyltransferase [Taibaiella koreensis]|uniref:class I SAM-dependent methyltransferase n=1 Tax=Taibaiella koreensis TaxID=1268548 RepID=UPI000E59A728|nr:class I SAM-dependent methyltransferase [Taibaiella koreensis]